MKSEEKYYASSTSILSSVLKDVTSRENSSYLVCYLSSSNSSCISKRFLNDATDEKEIVQYISFFWVFIIISTYINGIGLQIARIREYGLLKTYVMITGNRYTFLTAILLTQISFGAISLLLFTSIVSIYYRAFSFNLLLSSLIVLLVSFPLAIASVSIAAIPIKFNNLSTIMNILVYPLFFSH